MTLKQIMNQADRYNQAAAKLGLPACNARLTIRESGHPVDYQENIISAPYLVRLIEEDWILPVAEAFLEADNFLPNAGAPVLVYVPELVQDAAGDWQEKVRQTVYHVALEIFPA